MPNTGPSEGSRDVMIALFPIFSSPCTRPIEVTVLPSPETVGVVAVTRIILPSGRLGSPSISFRLTFALSGPRRSTMSSPSPSFAETASIANRFFFKSQTPARSF